MRLTTLEIILIQVVLYGLLWLSNEYIASLLMVIIPPIILSVFIISLIAERIEKTKIPRSYFKVMIISFLIPLTMGVLLLYLNDFQLDWMRK